MRNLCETLPWFIALPHAVLIKSMIILASKSKIRSRLLENAGINHRIMAANIDEAKFQHEFSHLKPQHLAQSLAEAKAHSVARLEPQALTIGADQTLEFEGGCLHKSADMTSARRLLKRLCGKTHLLHAAITVVKRDKILFNTVQTAALTMRHFTEQSLDDYLAQAGEDILQSVGCYQLEGLGVRLFEKIEGDYFTILGLPILPLLAFLGEIGELPP